MERSEKNRQMQKSRIYRYFIEAAVDIINESGIDAITIRNVSERAGYNSATLYNYFRNLNHLKFFAAISVLDKYVEKLDGVTNEKDNSREKYIKIWMAFAENSFEYPEHYYIVFFSEMQSNIDIYMPEYFHLFMKHSEKGEDTVSRMLKQTDISSRSMILMKECIKDGFVSEEKGGTLDEIVIHVYESLLNKVRKKMLSPEKAMNSFSRYLEILL